MTSLRSHIVAITCNSPFTVQSEDTSSLRSLTLLGAANNTIEVYAPDTRVMYRAPYGSISHHGSHCVGRRLLCRAHSDGVATNASDTGASKAAATETTLHTPHLPTDAYCCDGSRCTKVHIDVPLSTIKGDIIHVHYVYRDEALCQYERLSCAAAAAYPTNEAIATMQLTVHGPHQQGPAEQLPLGRIMMTEGALTAVGALLNEGKKLAVCHCAHYYFAQTCSRGASCSFIHVISVDPRQARDSTRPPAYRKRLAATGESDKGWTQMALSSMLNAKGLARLSTSPNVYANSLQMSEGCTDSYGHCIDSVDNMSTASGPACWSSPDLLGQNFIHTPHRRSNGSSVRILMEGSNVSPSTPSTVPYQHIHIRTPSMAARVPSVIIGDDSVEGAIARQESYTPSEEVFGSCVKPSSGTFMTRPPHGGIRILTPAIALNTGARSNPTIEANDDGRDFTLAGGTHGCSSMGIRASTLPFDDCPFSAGEVICTARPLSHSPLASALPPSRSPTLSAYCSPCACSSSVRGTHISAKVPANRYVHNPYQPILAPCCRNGGVSPAIANLSLDNKSAQTL